MTKSVEGVRLGPRWNIASLLSPLIAIPLAYVLSHNVRDSGWGWGGIGAIFVTRFGATAFGLIAGIVAVVRRERWPAITGIAILLNLYPIFALLLLILSH
jgi:hypothetical protein